MPTNPDSITPRQAMFAQVILETRGNATEAARLVYGHENDNVAGVTGWHTLRNPKVQKRIRELTEKFGPYLVKKETLQANVAEMAYNSKIRPNDRIKASELLMRSEGQLESSQVQAPQRVTNILNVINADKRTLVDALTDKLGLASRGIRTEEDAKSL